MGTKNNSTDERIPVPTIGEILTAEFLEPLEITPYRLAKELHVATSSILDIVHNRRNLSVDMALRFSKFFGTTEHFWLNLQNGIEIRNRRERLKQDLSRIHPVDRSA